MSSTEILSFAEKYIENFTLSSGGYICLEEPRGSWPPGDPKRIPYIDIEGATPQIFARPGRVSSAKVSIDSRNSSAKIYLGANLRGRISIKLQAEDQFVWIGDNCSFGSLILKCGISRDP